MLSERKWRPEAVIQMLIVLFTSICLLKVAWFGVDFFTPEMKQGDKQFFETVFSTLSFQGVIIVSVIVFLRSQRLSWAEAFGMSSTNFKVVIFGVLAGILFVPIAWGLMKCSMYLLESLQLNPESQEVVKTFQKSIKEPPHPELLRQQIAFGLSVIVFAPFAEETLFRGIIYPTFKQLGFPQLAMWGSSIVFALLHFNALTGASLLVLALCLIAVYELTDNLIAPLLMHSVFNASNFVFLIYEQQLRDLFSRIL